MNGARPFDLKKLDFETIRLRRRRRLILFSLPIGIMMTVMGLKFLSVPILSAAAHTDYQKQRFDAAVAWLSPLHVANWLESHKAPFNQGVALFKKQDLTGAEAAFRQALETVPEVQECAVRINLALTLEAQGDKLREEKQLDEAVLRYDAVKAVLQDGRSACVEPQDKQDVQTIQERVDKKSEDTKRNRNNDPSKQQQQGDQGNKDNENNNDSSAEKMKQLEERASEAQKERAKRQAQKRERNHSKGGQGGRGQGRRNW